MEAIKYKNTLVGFLHTGIAFRRVCVHVQGAVWKQRDHMRGHEKFARCQLLVLTLKNVYVKYAIDVFEGKYVQLKYH